MQSLPIWEIYADLLKAWREGNRAVLIAPTGSGKTTQVPQMFLDSGMAGERKIIVLQPRRVAARTVAARVAWERHCSVGGEVGYQIRFEDETSLGTRISFVTEGVLLRWLQHGGTLPDVSMVIFDEFHERNLLSDVALGLVKSLQQTRRPDLRIMVMSATLEAAPVAEYLGGCPVLESQGQSYPVAVSYLSQRDPRGFPEQAAETVGQIVRSGELGDILVFMPGMHEINATIREGKALRTGEPVDFIPLHGDLPAEEQDRAFAPSTHRKVVVSTNVAETSVTIEGIAFVVDSGLARVARYDAERGIGTLALEEISRASADQRKGRAGRTGPGKCFRLWTESNHLNRPARNTPEIQRADLAEVVLLLHSAGVREAANFDWLSKPDPAAVERAETLLWMLGALRTARGEESSLTQIGREMLRLPMHPRYSRMLIEGRKFGCAGVAALCAALVSGRDFLLRIGRESGHIADAREEFEQDERSDFLKLLNAYEYAWENRFELEACRRRGLHAQIGRQVAQTHQQLLEILGKQGVHSAEEPPSTEGLLRSIMAGFVDQLCLRKDKGSLDCFVAGGRAGTLARESIVQKHPLFVAANIREISGKNGPITLLSLASAVQIEWLRETFPGHFTARLEHVYDRTHKRVSAIRRERFLDLIIAQEHQKEIDPRASGRALAEAWQERCFELPLLNHEVKQLMARAHLASLALPELEFPDFHPPALLETLSAAFAGITLSKQAQETPLKPAVLERIGAGRLPWLEELCPSSIPWPDGRKIKLLYAEPGNVPEPPEIQVKLHECFSLQQHPLLCEGRIPVKLWLCAPDGKRLEATLDWPAFRANLYPKLKSGLSKKYPGVAWL